MERVSFAQPVVLVVVSVVSGGPSHGLALPLSTPRWLAATGTCAPKERHENIGEMRENERMEPSKNHGKLANLHSDHSE